MREETSGTAVKFNEEQLINDYRRGGSEALDTLFKGNEGLIHFVYNKFFRNCGCPKEDMIQEGYLGLFEAITRFKSLHSKAFIRYKILWIKKKMFDFRHKFFKYNFVQLNNEHELLEWQAPRSENLRKDIFDLDSLVKSGRIPKSRAKKLLNKIIKGKV